MWMLLLSITLQICFITELVLNRLISIFANKTRNPVRKLADGSFLVSLSATIATIMTIPFTLATALYEIVMRQTFLLLSSILIISIVAVLSEASGGLIFLFINVYNTGIGVVVHNVLISFLRLFAPLVRLLLPFWNAWTYVTMVFWSNTFLPFVFVNVDVIPALLLDLSMMASTLAFSWKAYFDVVMECATGVLQFDSSPSPFWVNDLKCVASPYSMTLDLMTPGIFMQKSAVNIQNMLQGSCSGSSTLVTLLMYPLIDYNMYKTIHGAVNAVLHLLVTMPIWTANRCLYGEQTLDHQYTDLEKKVMCVPDLSAIQSILRGTFQSFGAFIDNYLDMALVAVQNSVTGNVPTCEYPSVRAVWEGAGDVFGTHKLQVVGLTTSLYAVTDGTSVLYQSMSGAGMRSSFALNTWPFLVDLSFGLAAVRYSEANDPDDEGDERTGIFGCRCIDEKEGLQILCASVPYQTHLAEDDAENEAATVHRVRFMNERARIGLTCSTVAVRVNPLRFSRRRFSTASIRPSVEGGFLDPFNTRGDSGAKYGTSHTADASVVVMPLCTVEGSVFCMPAPDNCFPFCMGLHAAGQTTQNISLLNSAMWNEYTSLGQTDCVVSESVQACKGGSSLAVNDGVNVQIRGCKETSCSPDYSTTTFIKHANVNAQNRSLSTWKSNDVWGFIRSNDQPFVIAGDIFLYQKQTDERERSGIVLVTRLYDNKRGDFSLQQEQLSLVTNSDAITYVECSTEECVNNQILENNIVLPDQFFTRPSFVSAVSEWAVHWIATPDLNKCSVVFDYCSGTTGPIISEYMHVPKLWTIRTVRSPDELGKVDTTIRNFASFMVIPDWFDCKLNADQQCQRMASMKVTALEYLNSDNLLLTVMAASPAHWDANLDDIRPGMPFEYRYYFVHPNKHDCTSPGISDEPLYTCWRQHSAGMYNASDSMLVEAGTLCPAMQRMPKWGSLSAELGIGTLQTLTMFIDLLVTLPVLLSVSGGMVDVFDSRTHPTFHSMLDSNAARLFDFEGIILAVDRAAFHAGNTFSRISMLFDDRPGVEFIKPVLIGTGRIYEYTVGQMQMEDVIMGSMSKALKVIPIQKFMEKFSQYTQSPPDTPVAVTGSGGKTNLVQMFTSTFSAGVSWSKVILRISRKIAIRLLRRPKRKDAAVMKSLLVDDITRILLVSAYDSENDFKRGLFTSMRVVCDSAGQVIGRTTACGQFMRHSCMIWPDSLEAVMTTIFILFIDYQVMDCVCKQPNGFNTAEILETVCLPRIMPMAAKAFVLNEIPDPDPNAQPKSQCFLVMDSINNKLIKVMDPVLSRMYKAQTALESAIASIVSFDLSGSSTVGSGCTDWSTSPYVVSILPEPVDYFMGCMETIDCRSRCLDPMRAFEESLNAYRASKGPHRGFERPAIDMEVNSLYFSTLDEFEGKHLAPFAVYAVILLEPDVCQHVCSFSSQDSSRCVSVAGMDSTLDSGRPQGLITNAYYCVPASITMSVFKGSIPGSIRTEFMYADDALQTSTVTAMSLGTSHKALNGTSEWIVLSVRDLETGIASVLVMPSGADGTSIKLIETVDFHLSSYADTDDVNDARWNIQYINKVFVLPAHSKRRWMTVYVSASRTQPYMMDDNVCVYFYIDTSETGLLYDSIMHDCSGSHDKVFSPTHRTVCLDRDCSDLLRIPHQPGEIILEKMIGYSSGDDEVSAKFVWGTLQSRSFKMTKNQRSILDLPDKPALTILKDNRLQLTSRQVSTIGKVDSRTADGGFAVHIAMTGRADSQEVWLQNIDLRVPAVDGTAVSLQVAASFPVKQKLQMVVNCSVSSCIGCQGSGPLEIDLQNKCYSASSCAVARCVGTPVDMQRPLCQMASLIGSNADVFRLTLGSFWTTLSHTIIGIVELSANRRALYEISWPAEIVQMSVCNTKDALIEFWAVFGAMVGAGSGINFNNAASYKGTSMSVSKEARTAGIRVMSATAFVELMSHITMGVIYAPIVAWKMMQCQLNSAFVMFSNDNSAIRVGAAKLDKSDEAAIGMCIQEKIKQELRDMANPAVEQNLLTGLSSVASNVVGMISGGLIGPLQFTFDAFCAWALGIIKGLMNVVQVLDWTKCKLPDIDNAVVSRCVCGDKVARIPHEQRAAKKTAHSLWCYGPLMLTDTDGKELLIWNPYSLSELIQMQETGGDSRIVQYLDCISMDRCNFQELVPASAGTMENYTLCLKQARFQRTEKLEKEHCVRFQAYTDCINTKVDCEKLKPRNDVFDAQGVEVMQVITRCRNNYQRKKWDEAAILLGLLDHDAWRQETKTKVQSLSRVSEKDYLTVYRRHMSKLASFIQSFDDLDVSTWSCLQTAMLNKKWNHNCDELAYSNGIFPAASTALTYFEYEVASDAYTFVDMDACQSFSGKVSNGHNSVMTYPKMVWDGDSANAVPVAELHLLRQQNVQSRHANAELELDDLIQNTIMPAMTWFTEKKLEDIVTTYWSFEGDYIHQLIDCIILGPYAAADMLPSFKLGSENFKVPQYHRGSSESREIAYTTHSHGSPVRKNLIDKVVHHVSGVKDEILLRVVTETISNLKKTYSEKRNLYCQCIDGSRSLTCCMSNHDDLESFGHTFAAQHVVNELKDSAPQFLTGLAKSITDTTLLSSDLWTTDEFAFELNFDDDDTRMLAESYMFDFNETVYQYDETEVVQGRKHTLWSLCMTSLRASFFSMPVKSGGDGTIEVDADTIFDPTQFPSHDSEKYMHGMEQFIERILERAKKQSPVFWTHVHRYMPSDSVWCEGAQEYTPSDQRATFHEQPEEMTLDSTSVRAPDASNVLYVAQTMHSCVCGTQPSWSNGFRTCTLPQSICDSVVPSIEDHDRWTALCSFERQYSTPTDFMFIRQVLESNYQIPEECPEYAASTVWGLLDSKQHMSWYNGSSTEWRLSPQEIASTGPSGTRLADFVAETPRNFGQSNPWTREPDNGIFNTRYAHTIAQPVCNTGAQEFLKQNLSDYFREVLFPMAHSVHESPSQAICGRWVIEYSMFVFLLKTTGNNTKMVSEQRAVEEQWRLRCHTQLEQVGMCNLRGVYALVPSSHKSAKHCTFTVPSDHTCSTFYVTDNCLLMCNGVIYDPCLCDGAQDCQVSFTEQNCASARIMLPPSTEFDLSSMHWPRTVWPARQSTEYQKLLDAVNANVTLHGIPFYLDDDMTDYVLFRADAAEGTLTDAFCDDLVDYMHPDAQHPVGYHPTTSCFINQTNMRGFTSWMTTGGTSAWSIDPVRVRNMSSYSTTLGAAHLTCDATVYGVRGNKLNNLFLQSKWSRNSRADPAVPVPPDRVSDDGMDFLGEGSMDAHDTPLQANVDSNRRFQHTIGIVRDWLRYYGEDDNGTIQNALDQLWPHWQTVSQDSYGARPEDELYEGCMMPPLYTCNQNADCQDLTSALQCLLVSTEEDVEPIGICVRQNTCFRHSHCPDSQMCSGNGVCVDPEITVHNKNNREIDLQIYALESSQCLVSPYGLGKHQNVPTFASDNGLCGVRHFFNYNQTTYEERQFMSSRDFISVSDKQVRPVRSQSSTISSPSLALTDPDFPTLFSYPHECDRTYEHTDHKLCAPEQPNGIKVSDDSATPYPTIAKTLRTWSKNDQGIKINFCNLYGSAAELSDMLNPYKHTDEATMEQVDTLRETRRDIKRCWDFENICLESPYTVRGKKVSTRLVKTGNTMRRYQIKDLEMCMSFGVWNEEKCVLDRMIVPLFHVIYPDATGFLPSELDFEELRKHCPQAFGSAYADALARFQSTYVQLSNPYTSLDKIKMQTTINNLILQLFDMISDTSRNRGLPDMHTYTQHAKCIKHLYQRLDVVQKANAVQLAVYGIDESEVPGSSVYMFTGIAPVEVTLLWFWKCVVVALEDDGGVSVQWVRIMTTETEDDLYCENINTQSYMDRTLRRHLQLQSDIYISSVTAQTNVDLYSDILGTIEDTINFWDIYPIPTIYCYNATEPTDECETSKQQFGSKESACHRVAFPDTIVAPDPKTQLNVITMVETLVYLLFKRTRDTLDRMSGISLQFLLNENLAIELNVDTVLSRTVNYTNAIPTFELSALKNMTDIISQLDQEIYKIERPPTRCTRSTKDLVHSEYQILSTVCDRSAKTMQSRMYQKIMSFQEMSKNLTHFENFECYATDNNLYVSVSQKMALLLATYYMREILYVSSKSKLGRLDADQTVRKFMRSDVELSVNLRKHLYEGRAYDLSMRTRQFLCDEDKKISDRGPSRLQEKLQSCVAHMKEPTGWVVQSNGQSLTLQTKRDVFTGGFYLSFSTQQSNFIDELVDTDWHEAHHMYTQREMCFKSVHGATPLAPLWSGQLDVQSCPFGESCGCETTTGSSSVPYIDITCDGSDSLLSCSKDYPLFYEQVYTKMYAQDCASKQSRSVPLANYEQMKNGNLCSRRPRDTSICSTKFGAVGGVTGSAVHNLHEVDPVQYMQTGLFGNESRLLQGLLLTDTAHVHSIRLKNTDIGGQSIAVTVHEYGENTDTRLVMQVTCVSAGFHCRDKYITRWLQQTQALWKWQHSQYVSRSVRTETRNVRWSCPLQWLSTYGDNRTAYVARSPSANRNALRFRHITGDSFFAHAVVSSTLRVAQHPARFLSDASACVDASVTKNGLEFNCRGKDLLHAAVMLHKQAWTTVKFHTSSAPCTDILDWPHRAFRTMDGGNGGESRDTTKYCNVFDRLPSFALRYNTMPVEVLTKNINSGSTAKGGACNMGRLKKFKQVNTTDMVQLCTAFPSLSTCTVLQRNDRWNENGKPEFSWSSKDIPVQEPFKQKKQKPSRKRKCSRCESHAQGSFIDRLSRENPLSNSIRQLSVGVPIAIAPERAIAANLRRKVCTSASSDCPELFHVLPRESWEQRKLMRGLIKLSKDHQHSMPATVLDDDLWKDPWVFCTFENDIPTCRGSMTKDEWKDPARRSDACSREMVKSNTENRKPIRICDLSDELEALCVNLGTWNSKIEYILCKAAGHPQCSEQGFFYNPTDYSFSNQDFVYNTVRKMYHQLNDSACPAVYVNKQDIQNELLKGQCSSVALEPLRTIVNTARGFGYDLTIILYCEMQIFVYLWALIIGSIGQLNTLIAEASRNLNMYVTLFLNKIVSIMDRITKMIWKLLDFDPFKGIKKAARLFCIILQDVIEPLMRRTIHPAASFMADFIRAFDRILTRPLYEFIKGFGFGWDPKGLLETNEKNIRFWEGVSESAKKFEGRCEDDGIDEDSTDPVGVLPVATKCWSTYTTFFGDNSMLSCTAADTCHRGVMDTNLITCGLCPEPQTNFKKFGCFEITKICTCGVSVLKQQYCTANEDCSTSESSCKYLDSELEPSNGFTPCTSCQSSRLCYMQPGMSMGYCACGLFQIKFARCLDHAKNVNPGYDDMCIFTSDPNFLRSVSFTFSFDTTISTPCRMINPSFSFCSRESNGQLYVVGTDISRRRHLLESSPSDTEVHFETASALCQDAIASDQMPNVRANCIALYHDSRLTVQELGLQGILPECAFCGIDDAFAAFVLQPHNMITLTTNITAVAKVVFRHTPFKHLFSTLKTTRRYVEVILYSIASNEEEITQIQHTTNGWQVHILSNDTIAIFFMESVFPHLLNWIVPHNKSNHAHNHTGRKLLSVVDTATETMQDAMTRATTLHKTFQSKLAAAFTFPFETIQHRSQWMTSWPPKVGHHSTESTCQPLFNVIRGMQWSVGNLSKSFQPMTLKPKTTLGESWVSIPRNNNTGSSYNFNQTTEDLPTSSLMWLSKQILYAVGLELDSFYDLIHATLLELPLFMRCNYESVQTCSRWDMHMLHAAIIAAVYFSIFVVVCNTFQVSLLAIAMLGAFPLIVMYMSYGYSPFCVPMIPVCIMDDLLWTVNSLFPDFIELPSSMYRSNTCLANSQDYINKDCLIKCTDPKFNYKHWYDVGAWWAVELHLEEPFQRYASFLLSADDVENLEDQIILKLACLDQNDSSLITGNRICAALSLYKLLPYVLLAFLLLFAFGTIIRTIWTVTSSVLFSILVLYVTSFY